MKELTITSIEENQKINTYMRKVFPSVTTGFLYKMYRKKNIILNGKKIKGTEVIKSGDLITIYFSDETYDEFARPVPKPSDDAAYTIHPWHHHLNILYEDEHFLIINKPVGLLSQPDGKHASVSDNLERYLSPMAKNVIGYKPGISNRLDRNTSGLILAGKSVKAVQVLNSAIAEKKVRKFYRTILVGEIKESQHLKAYIKKDKKQNKSYIQERDETNIETIINPLMCNEGYTLAEIEILTGKSHQIRAHLAHIGHPLIGDSKYGKKQANQLFKKKFQLKHHLLHANSVLFVDIKEPLEYLNGKLFEAETPLLFKQIEAYLFGKE